MGLTALLLCLIVLITLASALVIVYLLLERKALQDTIRVRLRAYSVLYDDYMAVQARCKDCFK